MTSKEYFQNYYQKNREKYLSRAKAWKKNNPEARERHVAAWKDSIRVRRSTIPKRRAVALWTAAKKRTKEFSITLEFVIDLVENAPDACPYTGVPFDYSTPEKGARNPWAPSLDRIDSTKGYTPDNVEIVSTWYNVAKNGWTPDVNERGFRGAASKFPPASL